MPVGCVCVGAGGYCWQTLGGREKAKGEARVRQVKDILKGLWTTTEKSPPAALGEHAKFEMFKTVGLAPRPGRQDTGPIKLHTRLRGSWESPHSRMAGQSNSL